MNSSSLHNSPGGANSGIHIGLFDNSRHRDQVVALWEAIFAYPAPHNRPSLSIDRKLEVRDGLFFVALDGTEVVGTTMAGYDGHRGYIYSVAVRPSHRKQGIGTALVARAEEALAARGCLKINLQILEGNEDVTAFYASLGYAVERRTNMGKVLPAPAE
ncbi:MAG TPA: GNAT family acetyltransferase [Verrucomicrobiales bacterium]|nr:GNAT family acetyltransferase [Verrucomicrobiales bacterium]